MSRRRLDVNVTSFFFEKLIFKNPGERKANSFKKHSKIKLKPQEKMSTLANVISKAISTNLLSSLPTELAEHFGLDTTEVSQFLNEYLAKQLPAIGKASTKRTPAPKGTNGKGAIRGFILFSNATRAQVISDAEGETFYKQRNTKVKGTNGKCVYEDVLDAEGQRIECSIPPTEVSTRLGAMWRELSDKEKAEWNLKADKANVINGLEPSKSGGNSANSSPVKKAKAVVTKTTVVKTVAPPTVTHNVDLKA